MLSRARERFGGRVELVETSAEALPFPDGAFDHLTFTYLLRYVDDVGATLAELARVVRPGGVVASLEFGVPGGLARPAWDLYVGVGLPLAGRALRGGWREVGDFLGGSIRDFWSRYPIERQLELWSAAGVTGIEVRRLSLGGAVVVWGRRT
jgi:demethylmenaquinone methyltransferase/2-methoxy-6-polyprenyl-1,4-benzoquinol methylase